MTGVSEGIVRTPETEYLWDGYARGELLLQRCLTCSALRFLPAYVCRECGAMEWEPIAAAGRGTVYSYIVTRRPPLPLSEEFPVIVLVELEEGPRLIANLVDVEPADVAIGMAVETWYRAVSDGEPIVRFRPASAEGR